MPPCVLFWSIYPAWYNLSFLGLWFGVANFVNFSAIIFSNIFCPPHSGSYLSFWHSNKVFVRLSNTIPQLSDVLFSVFFSCWFYFYLLLFLFSLCVSVWLISMAPSDLAHFPSLLLEHLAYLNTVILSSLPGSLSGSVGWVSNSWLRVSSWSHGSGDQAPRKA